MYRITLRSASAARNMAPSSAVTRLNQVNRHFSASSPTKQLQDVYILSAARTPTGKFHGGLKAITAPKLGAVVIKEALARSAVPASKIGEVYMGNVLQAGVGQAPARQAVIFAGLPESCEAITINKVCASGLKSVVFAAQNIQLGLSEAAIAGGMESMTLVPRYVPKTAPTYGHVTAEDGIIKDGLWDVYNEFAMGNCAENTAKNLNITRQDQDAFAIQSYKRATAAWQSSQFDEEIVPVPIPAARKGNPSTTMTTDEDYDAINYDKVPTLKPAFIRDGTGTVTAANSSTLNDGASAIVIANTSIAKQYGSSSRVLSKIISSADAAVAPIDFPIAPAKAIPIALERAGITKDDVAVWEINEAFAAVSKANEKVLGLDPAKVNIKGGAIALGHALGSSGSRILTTLLYQLKVGEYGVAAICNGGGGATAMVVKRVGHDEL